MILVRVIYQARFGQGGQLAAHLAATTPALVAELGGQQPWRLLTDLSGPFDTVVLEGDVESLAAWEQALPRVFQSRTIQESAEQMQAMVLSGRTEYFTIAAQG